MELNEGYKQTEVGVIPEDWDATPLPKIIWYQEGPGLRKWQFRSHGLKVINVTNLQENGYLDLSLTNRHISWEEFERTYRHFLADEGDVVMASSGNSYCKTSVIRERDLPLLMNTSVIRFKPKEATTRQFMLIYLKSDYFKDQIDLMITGGAQPNFGPAHLSKVIIPLPPTKAEQEAIAEALSDADALLESLEQLIAKKRQVKQGAMQELLTGKKRLPGFSAEWEETPLSEACWFQEGPGVRNYQFTTSGVKLFNGTNIEKGRIDLAKTNRFISEREAYGCYSHFLADAGDVVIACSGITVEKFDEKVAVLGEEHLPLCMNTSTMRFKVKPVKMHRDYLLQLLASSLFKQQIGGSATGSAQLNFGPSHVSKVSVPLPHPDEQTAIATILSDMDAEIAALETKLAKARQVKQGMMQELLTGNIRLI